MTSAQQSQAVDIGIDLGTTFSVVAVPGRWPTAPGYPSGEYLEDIQVTILRTPDGDLLFPSVLWFNSATGCMTVGAEARDKALEGEAPLFFTKRAIGTNEPLTVGGRVFTAREAACEILKYLKTCAERALGRPVRRAVVTHPAYFNTNQIEETRQAAIAAGLDVDRTEQLLMEPIAAALAYLRTDDRDPLTVMTYDLGGGTFDVTILQRQDGDTRVIAHSGDRLLGGFDFDRRLVNWLIKRLRARGRSIRFDEQRVEDVGRHTRLMRLAESVKIKLSEQRNRKAYVSINAPDILVDDQGRPVPIQDRINLEEYAALIQPKLDETVACCRRALEIARAKVPGLQVDSLLFVGGSTYGPWVADTVSDALQLTGESFQPDLCVAAGAAIHAAQLPRVFGGAGSWQLLLESPQESPLPNCTIAGSLRSSTGSIVKTTIELHRDEEIVARQVPSHQGSFAFADVSLDTSCPTKFRLLARDSAGNVLFSETFAVVYRPDQSTTQIWPLLPKSVFVETVDGQRLVAGSGAQLPTPEHRIDLERTHQDDMVIIPVYQEEERVGEITILNIPAEAGRDAPVKLQLRITEKNELLGSAAVLTRGDARTAVECPVYLAFPPIEIPSLDELRRRFRDIESQRQQLQDASGDAEQRARVMVQGNRIAAGIDSLFDEMNPDKQGLFRELRQLEQLVTPRRDELQPPRMQFRWKVAACRAILATQPGNVELSSYLPQIESAEKQGGEAFQARNQRRWSAAYQSIDRLHRQLEQVAAPPPPRTVTTPEVKAAWKQDVDDLRQQLTDRAAAVRQAKPHDTRLPQRIATVAADLNEMEAAIASIPDDLDVETARARLHVAITALKPVVERKLRELGSDTRSANSPSDEFRS